MVFHADLVPSLPDPLTLSVCAWGTTRAGRAPHDVPSAGRETGGGRVLSSGTSPLDTQAGQHLAELSHGEGEARMRGFQLRHPLLQVVAQLRIGREAVAFPVCKHGLQETASFASSFGHLRTR